MQSLRTRRPSAGQKPARQPTKLAKGPAKSRSGSTRKSRVDDKIKKRMSMRYADISAPTDALVPAVPALPIGAGGGVRAGGQAAPPAELQQAQFGDGRLVAEPREDAGAAELRLLDREDFDPDACAWCALCVWRGAAG